jgi:signal transduction histidine kinase
MGGRTGWEQRSLAPPRCSWLAGVPPPAAAGLTMLWSATTFPACCLHFACAEHTTRLVLDAGRRTWARLLTGPGIGATTTRLTGRATLTLPTSSPTKPAATRRRLHALSAGLSPRRRLAGALTGLVVLPLLTLGMDKLLRGILNMPSQMLLYLLVVVVVALVGGLIPALAAAVAASLLLAYYFIPPMRDFGVAGLNNVVAVVGFLLVAGAVSSVVGVAARRTREAEALANANAVLAEEQAALRRVATLVARGLPPAEIFAAVTHEVGSVLGAEDALIVRLEPEGAMTVASTGAYAATIPVGSRWNIDPPLALAVALRTGHPARLDDISQAPGAYGDAIRRLGIRSAVAAPIVVEGDAWGAIAVGSRRERLPADTEERLARFTELVGAAIANADSREELRVLAEEQAALRRVATLVARGVPPAEVIAAVTHEVGRVLGSDATVIVRLDPDGAAIVAASTGAYAEAMPVGSRWELEPPLAMAAVLNTGRPARLDDYVHASCAYGEVVRRVGVRSGVAAPIVVEARLWGGIGVGTRRERFPADTEQRMAGFTELIGTAIANADSGAQLTASRARIVAAADDARRRIERDLHDGTQQRLVALSLALRLAQSTVPADLPALQAQIGRVADELTGATEELREIARGIHPAILSDGGLGPALRTLARRTAIPVELEYRAQNRTRERIEVAAYYVVSEALTNTTKHARASYAQVTVEQRDAMLCLSIRDDGIGGADPAGGTGLIGMRDRVQALDGSIEINSRPGDGTAIVVELPLQPA